MRRLLTLFLLIPLILFMGVIHSDSYKQFKEERKIIAKYTYLFKYYEWIEQDRQVFSYIYFYAKRYNITPELICAIIQAESGEYCKNNLKWMARVKSYAGAIGIMQVMPFHSKTPWKLKKLKYNISKGVWYFNKCLKKSKGNIREACRYYNAGLNNKRWRYKNWKYVDKIQRHHNAVTKQYKNIDERFIAYL